MENVTASPADGSTRSARSAARRAELEAKRREFLHAAAEAGHRAEVKPATTADGSHEAGEGSVWCSCGGYRSVEGKLKAVTAQWLSHARGAMQPNAYEMQEAS